MSARPYSLTETDHLRLVQLHNALRFPQHLTEMQHTPEYEGVMSYLWLLEEQVGRILASIDEGLASKQGAKR